MPPPASKTIDEYISHFAPDVRATLAKIRATIRRAAPRAQETISYQIPAFRMNGVLVWFAASKKHIALFPPVRREAALIKAAKKYASEKGSLRFPHGQPVPYHLITRIVKHRLKLDQAKAAAAKPRTKSPAKKKRPSK